jgi:hypothetical protein
MALPIEKAFGVKMETLLDMEAWHYGYAMRQREGEIGVKLPAPCRLKRADPRTCVACAEGRLTTPV